MKSNLLIFFVVFLFVVGCNQTKKDALNYIAFKVPKNEMIDSLKTAVYLLDQMDYGNGASCNIWEGELRHTRKEPGFTVIEIPKNDASFFPIIEPLSTGDSKRLYNLMLFLNRNGIRSIGKDGYDNRYSFLYKQTELNPHNNYNESRTIIYIKSEEDKQSKFFVRNVILDSYKNIVLTAPKSYNGAKLSMDSTSIMKRRDEWLKDNKELLKEQKEYREAKKK
jgi:hypothetical protein